MPLSVCQRENVCLISSVKGDGTRSAALDVSPLLHFNLSVCKFQFELCWLLQKQDCTLASVVYQALIRQVSI